MLEVKVDKVTPQFVYIKELAQLKYEAEEKREQSLIRQSSQMQTVFSFVTAALFMALPVCIQYRGVLSLKFFLISVSIPTMFLLSSLVCASIAQWRWKTKTFPDIRDIKNIVIDNPEWENYINLSYRIDQWVNLIAKVQHEKSKLNGRRVGLIMASMICFLCSIVSITISFLVAIIQMIE